MTATERSTPSQWLYKLLHPTGHHTEPWGAATAWHIQTEKDLVSYAVSGDGDRYLLFPNRVEVYRKKILEATWTGFFTGATSIATNGSYVFVADSVSNRIYAFDRAGSLMQSVTNDNTVPDELIAQNSYLYGFNYSDKHLSRYAIEDPQDYGQNRARHVGANKVAFTKMATPSSDKDRRVISATSDHLTINTIEAAEDFAVFGSAIYILEPSENKLTEVSFQGGGIHTININGLLGSVHEIASTSQGLLFADSSTHNFRHLRKIVPASLFVKSLHPDEDIGEFYSELWGRNLLPTETLEVSGKEHLESIIRDRYLNSPEGISVLCDVNSYSPDCLQKIGLPARLIVPALHIESYDTTASVVLRETSKDKTAAQTLASALGASTPEASSQREKIKSANPWFRGPDILEATKGKYVVPVRGVQVDGFLGTESYKKNYPFRRYLSSTAILALPVRASVKSSGFLKLRNTILNDGLDQPGAAQRKNSWLSVVHANDLHEAEPVAIVDFTFNPNHALFDKDQFALYKPNKDLVAVTKQDEESHADIEHPKAFIDKKDHGTHVAGLIGGRSIDGNPFGINPGTPLSGVSTNDFVAAVERQDFMIYNISLGEEDFSDGDGTPGSSDGLKGWPNEIRTHPDPLFVIAAGNESSQISGGHLAGLGKEPNVLTVLATDSAGMNVWKRVDGKAGSNYGDFVDIAAPGESLTSGTYDGGWGLASGTSQATALVSGAASILRGKYPALESWQIKQRLITTTQAGPWIGQNQTMSQGGLLDVSAAISNANKTVVQFRNVDGPCVGKFSPGQAQI